MEINFEWRADWKRVPLPCPKCEGTFYASLPEIEQERTFRCSNGHDVTVTDGDGTIAEVTRSVEDLGK